LHGTVRFEAEVCPSYRDVPVAVLELVLELELDVFLPFLAYSVFVCLSFPMNVLVLARTTIPFAIRSISSPFSFLSQCHSISYSILPEMTAQSRTQQWRQAFGDPATTLSFAELSQQYPIPHENNDKEEGIHVESPSSSSSTSSALDPLTAMYMQDLQEQTNLQTRQWQYRQQQKRRKSSRLQQSQEDESLTIPEQRAVSWQILQKDLHRLPDPDIVCCLAHRKQLIAHVLFVWLCHTHTEYQQGMHEVLSFLLYALEVDATETTLSTTTASGDSYFAQTLLEFVSIILPAILPSYESSLQPMTARMLQQIQRYHPLVYQRLQGLPLQLVFCKWIRLLFAREVTDVLALWDVLFPYCSPSTTTSSLLTACEALCIARLLLHRDWILETPQDDLLHWLMNVAPEESFELWIPLFSRIVQHAPVDDLLPPPSPTTTANTATNTSSWTDPLSHAFSQLAMTPARVIHNQNHDNHNTNNNPFSAFKERWVQPSEQLLTQKIHSVSQRLFASTQPAERDYSDPTATAFRDESSTAQQMQQALNTVAAYLMEQPHVPIPVQQAMAELQVIQQDLSRQFS
jgi:hypothetical protein